jgi:hypothetical protein
MPGKLVKWPDWPEFTEAKGEIEEDLLQYKADVACHYGTQSLRKSWLMVCKELEKVTAELAEKGTSAIPEVQYNQLSQLSPEHKQRLKEVGCFVVRGVVSQEQATQWFEDLNQHVVDNRQQISGQKCWAEVLEGY